MNRQQRKEFEGLGTKQERAAWLLKHGVTAKLTVDPDKLSLAYRAEVLDTPLLMGFYRTERAAIAGATKKLQLIAAS